MSYNFGAKKADKIITVYDLAIKTSTIIAFVFFLICLILGKQIISIFTSDKSIIDMSYVALNLTNLAYFLIGKNLTTTVYYQAIEITKYSNLIGALRSILMLPLVLLLLSKLFGANGIWISMFVSELLTMLVISKIANIKNCTYESIKC